MPDDSFYGSIDGIDLKDALALAAHIEQLLMAEQQWILNRLSWLFTSQSFLITAFVVLLGSGNHSPPCPPVANYTATFGSILLCNCSNSD